MNSLVETLNRNEVLDAEWYCNILGADITKLSVHDMLGITGSITNIGQMIFGKYRLVLIYDKQQEGLFDSASSDEELRDYISSHIEDAFDKAVKQYAPYVYLLNIASTQNFGRFEWKHNCELLQRQLEIFMPIIQKFMVDSIAQS